MITGIQDIYFNVEDMDGAVGFYTENLGCTKVHGDAHWTSLELAGVKIGLHWTGGGPVPTTPRDSHGAHCGGTLTFRSDNVGEDKARLEQAGAKILGEMDEQWGHMLIFEDPDGNVLKLMKPKG